MIHSSLRNEVPLSTRWCVVYDVRDGRVVHIHQFIEDCHRPEREARESRAQMALEGARLLCEPQHLRVVHAPPGFDLQVGGMCQVDVESGEISVITQPNHSIAEFLEARTKDKKRGREGRESIPDE